MSNLYERLLKKWCDALISLQDKSDDKAFRGGIYCRACKNVHGRCPDAVYGFVVAAKVFGDEKYLQAAKDVFAYGENLLCKDGGLYNDAQTTWRYTTTFHEIAVIEALEAGGDILDGVTKAAFLSRAERMAAWLYENLDERSPANINYATTNALALALAGKLFGEKKYSERAKRLVGYAMEHISESEFLYGECKPHDRRSKKGCIAVDVGYNVEESVPALVKYAAAVGDRELMNRLEPIVRAHLALMLPDGAWDNSFGVRNNKWTYWGSRTSDGCAPMLLLLADRDMTFAEAALRNTELLERCSPDGFLYGGPHYMMHGEHACTHHTFEHVNSIAFAVENIDKKYLDFPRTSIPADGRDMFSYYPELRTCRAAKGDYLATFTDSDFDVSFSGHATGGTLTALYHRKAGPMVMGAVTDYVLVEPTNMQQVLDRENHRSLVPRFCALHDGKDFSSSRFEFAEMHAREEGDGYVVEVQTGLAAADGDVLGIRPRVTYTLTASSMKITATNAQGTAFVLPLVHGNCRTLAGAIKKAEKTFFLTPGFAATEYTVVPDESGRFEVWIEE